MSRGGTSFVSPIARLVSALFLFTLFLRLPGAISQGPTFQADADWEEFEEDVDAIPEQPQQRPEEPKTVEQKRDPTNEAGTPKSKFSFVLTPAVGDWFYVEAASIALLVAFAANYFYGRRVNRRIALTWARTFAQLLNSNFSRVGQGSALLVRDSESKYRMPATGRRNCHGLQATLHLSRRHDLFAMLYEFFMPSRDTLMIEVALENIDPLVFALVPNSRAKAVSKDHPDVSRFAKPVPWPNLSEWFTVLAESEEVAGAVLGKHIAPTIAKDHKFVRYFHVSDRFKHGNYRRMFRLELLLPEPEQMQELTALMRMAIFLIDHLDCLKLSPGAKARADKKRAKAAEETAKVRRAKREEAMQQKKAEKRAKEKERLKELPPDQQAKAEEREARRARKKKMGKIKVMYG